MFGKDDVCVIGGLFILNPKPIQNPTTQRHYNIASRCGITLRQLQFVDSQKSCRPFFYFYFFIQMSHLVRGTRLAEVEHKISQ